MAVTRTFGRVARRLADCRRGAAALEFALALPVTLMLIIGMLEVAMVMFVSTSVEGGLREAARYGITGQVPETGTREEAIVAIIDRYTMGFVDASPSNVSFKVYDSFNDVGQPEPWDDENGNGAYDAGETYTDLNGNAQWDEDRGTAGIGASGDVVLYRIDYDWSLITPFLASVLGDDGVFHMSASVAVKNEPYDLGGQSS